MKVSVEERKEAHLIMHLARFPIYAWCDGKIIALSLLLQIFSTFDLFFDVKKRVKVRKNKVNVNWPNCI